jgi:alkylhydroperoxidase family enzyme
VRQIRAGRPTGDAKRDTLVRLVGKLVKTSGTIRDRDFSTIKAAGYTDQQLVDISLTIAVITFTNVFNRINNTELDYSAVA